MDNAGSRAIKVETAAPTRTSFRVSGTMSHMGQKIRDKPTKTGQFPEVIEKPRWDCSFAALVDEPPLLETLVASKSIRRTAKANLQH
ncbi:hypothetical protein AVEN_214806-1 [Araneus ventricosus]|uniref:Uncharacterized protein n=2 Tax=Araneus ventricosus TaxID=182803 RepID=A0A4Y2R2L5_ARAVE|nr:hypothetical protein AVEN_267619-1 [Araneus ventricosus]GBN69545.1 hypothetical protein AVEN_214806-1 [Araneus ventricosus]